MARILSPVKKLSILTQAQSLSLGIQMHVINDALTRKIRNMPQYDGVDGRDNPIVRVGSKNGGRGYKPYKKDPNNPRVIENMDRAEIKFNEETGKPFTAFPTTEK